MPNLVLAQPITGEIGNDGRLLRADGPLLRLHMLAGGEEGGSLAVPQLAVLAGLSQRLKMKLSRAVRVADDTEDLELWVEAKAEGDVTKLSIISWRSVVSTRENELLLSVREQQIETLEKATILQLDSKLRLVSLAGPSPVGFATQLFGQQMQSIFEHLFLQEKVVDEAIDAITAGDSFSQMHMRLLASEQIVMVSGNPQHGSNAAFCGYQLFIDYLRSSYSDAGTATSEARGVSFGRQLAPVLRQPLGRIIANAETIGSELQGPIRENYAVYAKDIADAARHLATLVDDLGDLEVVEKADFAVAPDQIELGDISRRVAGLLALKAADHSIRVITPNDTLKVPAVAEFRRVLQIMINLVTNAIRYSPDGTDITIEMDSADGFSEISVSDQGAGIAPEDRDRVFDKFERLGRSGDGGSGLGLYISRRLARAMGGDLTIESAIGGGAKFVLRLPAN